MSRIRFPLSPSSLVVWIWDCFIVLGVLLSFLSFFYLVAFYSSLLRVLVLFYVGDVLHAVDLVVRFFVAYKERGVVVASLRKNAWRIVKTTLIVDIASIIPLEVFALASSNVYTVAAWLRFNRLLRLYKIVVFFSKYTCTIPTILLVGIFNTKRVYVWYT